MNDHLESNILKCIRLQRHFMQRGDVQMASFWQRVGRTYEKQQEEQRRELHRQISLLQSDNDAVIGTARRRIA